MRKFFLTSFLLIFSLSLCAQSEEHTPFNGLITDIVGNPLKNARIWVKNEQRYAQSNKKGQFGLTDVQADDTLHVRYKKLTYDIPVAGRRSLKIIIADDVEAVEDEKLIDLGYGYIKKRECTTPRGGISGDDLRNSGKTTILEALVGRIPGLNIATGGTFGMAQSVNIRGVNSLNLDNTPLYIVDGVVVQSLDYISLFDVDYVEVLKDASIYGARGANGAIIVHTRMGGNK